MIRLLFYWEEMEKKNRGKGRAGYNEDCNGKYKRLQTFKMSLVLPVLRIYSSYSVWLSRQELSVYSTSGR